MKRNYLVLLCCMLTTACVLGQTPSKGQLNIIPEPVSISTSEGTFTLSAQTKIAYDNVPKTDPLISYVVTYLEKYTGFKNLQTKNAKGNNVVVFSLNKKKNKTLGNEGYTLSVMPHRVVVAANTTTGLFYGFQTLYQLMPMEIITHHQNEIALPCAEITDYPRFEWRGNHMDCVRHFFSIDYIKKHLDMLAVYKINKFHWHLTDEQGWRPQIDKYPLLTEIGAWRVDRENEPWEKITPPKEGEKATYGGFYTKAEMKDIVKYAAERHIDVIPEIEFPGHCSAILAAYPEYACDDEHYYVQPGDYWPPKAILCAGNDKTLVFLKDVLSEIAEIFPYEYIHVGGDEAYKDNWKICPKCQKRIKELQLKNEEELQGWMVEEIEKFLNAKGKKIIGWDELLDGKVTPTATIMSWRGTKGGIAAAKRGNTVIMSPNRFCYYDYYQGNRRFQPEAIGGFVSLKKAYEFDPIPDDLTPEEGAFVKGGQANLWAEFIKTPEHMEYMLLPRICALSECVWSEKAHKNWNHFRDKIDEHKKRIGAMGYNYCKGSFAPIVTVDTLAQNRYRITLDNEVKNTIMYYTVSGQTTSPVLYTQPFEVPKNCTIKAITLYKGEWQEEPTVIEVK